MNLVGDPILSEEAFELGLVNRLVEDHELLDTALMWARKLAGQAPSAVAQIKYVSANGDLDAGIEAEKGGFAAAFASEDAKEGISAFLGKRAPSSKAADLVSPRVVTAARAPAAGGAVTGGLGPSAGIERLAELILSARSVVALTGAGISLPSGIPDFRGRAGTQKGLWEKVNPMEVAHIDAFHGDPVRFWGFYGERFASLEGKQPNGAHGVLAEFEGDGLLDGLITQNIDMLHRRAGSGGCGGELIEVHGSIASGSCLSCPGSVALEEAAAAAGGCRRRGTPLRSLRLAAEAGCRAVRRAPRRTLAAASPGALRACRSCCSASAPRWRFTRSQGCRC